MAAALEAGLEGSRANEARLLSQLEGLHAQLERAKAEIAERADSSKQIEAMRREIQRVRSLQICLIMT
jgi:multidrug resistance efflux pump